jgi:hypothetical protein
MEQRAANRLLIRLDTLAERPGYPVRLARSDSALGWWHRIAPDSARVDLLTAGIVVVSATQRIACPDPE